MRSSRIALLVAVASLPLVLWAALPVLSTGSPRSRAAALGSKIDQKREQIEAKKSRERVLSSTVARYSKRIGSLQGDITVLQRKQIAIQGDLDAKRAELARIQEDLRQERIRLARLRARLAEARIALAGRLVELYKSDKPDVVTVVLESDGFADLLERTEFMQRVSDQDARIIDRVRIARADATRTAERLDVLEARQTKVAAAIEARRDAVSRVRGQLVDRRDAYAAVRSDKATALVSTRETRKHLEGDLAALEAANAKVQSQIAAAQNGTAPGAAGPIRPGAGGLVWPVNGPIVSPFGMRWGRLHAGVDIAVPAGTPIRAAQSGKVILMGWTGGYGNYTCIGHGNGLSTCYAHQSSYATSNGASVSRGQVIGSVGCTGHCFGDHLHFETRVGGAPVNPAGYL
ncbi:MAG TPA: peptidoglycan DD-metalloendopeptidase family protein [Solirubrobacteraceae bacterium]|nr:peptidoglycan DD-metalloendopeptidase family protein [Solirubrobacteraceae bacterium]